MAKKTKKQIKQKTEQPAPQEKYNLVELFYSTTGDESWKIYNLSRKGLMQQFEQELQDYGQKHIEPTLTAEEFEDIIQGKQ